MSADRARISFDPSRQWRGVVSQQGRVTIEADTNEAGTIAGAERRAELLDVVGPSGTPDDGYKVLPAASTSTPGDLFIGAGTMYVGGERMVLAQQLDYASQPDWVDSAADPLWVAPDVPSASNEAVYLLLREQEVGAVEDPTLLDIALGGPDTAARTRIVQRVVRASTTAADAADVPASLASDWTKEGLTFDAATSQLSSRATLQVSFQQTTELASLCQPSGQGGYVGAENQLIRVQVAAVTNGTPTLVWGFDNASFLYRISGSPPANATTVTLASAPVDSYHQPASGQAVEILQAAAMLSPSDTADYIAATTGTVTTLTKPYDPSTGQVELAEPLSADQAASPLLFLRVWEETFTYSSGPVALGQTGLQVTLANAGSTWHVGDYWTFAVRPGTPTSLSPVYPERILTSPQPPDGPSMWACELALVSWTGSTPTITDLRQQFNDLVTLTEQAHGCCTVEITPDSVDGGSTLQALVDTYAKLGPTTICFQPGTYTLPKPLVIQAGVSALTLEACMGGVVIEAAGNSAPFTLGLIVAQSAVDSAGAANGDGTTTTTTTTAAGSTTPPATTTPAATVTEVEDVAPFTVRGMEFSMPPISFPFSASAISGLPAQRQALLTGFGNELEVSFGMSVLGCSNVTIEECRFYFPDVGSTNLFSAAIYATGTTAGVEVSGCSFVNAPEPESAPFSEMRLGTLSAPPYQVCFGYLQVPTQPPAPTATTTTTVTAGPTITPVENVALWREVPLAEQTTAAFEAPSVTERVEESSEPLSEEAAPAPTTPTPSAAAEGGVARAFTRIARALRSTPAGEPSEPVSPELDVSPITSEIPIFTTGVPITELPILTTSFPILTTQRPIITTQPGTTATTSTSTSTTTPTPTTTAGPPPPLTLTNPALEDAVFTRNTFDGLTVPVLVLGDVGVVSVADNTVRACYGGFWFVPADGDTAVALLDLFDPTDAAASSYAAQYNITALTDPVLWLATALGRLLPLTPPAAHVAIVFKPIALPTNLLTGVSTLLQTLAAAPTTTTTTPPGATTAAPAAEGLGPRAAFARAVDPTLEKEIGETIRPIEGIAPVETIRPIEGIGVVDTPVGEEGIGTVDIEREPVLRLPTFGDLIGIPRIGPVFFPLLIPSAEMGLGTTPRLDFHGNEIEAIVESTYSGTGLLVAVMLTDGTVVSVLCNGNRIRGRVSGAPAVSINQVTQCTMTGNLISNEIIDPSAPASPEPSVTPPSTTQAGTSSTPATTSPSLVLEPVLLNPPTPASGAVAVPTALVAVTGNVLIGDPPTLPARPSGLPTGFTVWDALNTIVSYVAPPPPTTTTTTTTTGGPS